MFPILCFQIGEILFILTMVGLCRAGKLLKTPRIYNAFVTSDEKLLPSQAYPAIAPVVQGIQYPLPGYIAAPPLYHPFIPYPAFNGVTTTGGRSFSYAVKQDYFSYNYFENDAAYDGKVPVVPDPAQPAILAPVGLQPLPKETLPYPASDGRANTKNEYHNEQQQDDDEEPNRNDYEVPNAKAARKGQPQRGPASRNRGQQKHHQPEAHAQQSYDSSDSADDTGEPGTEGEHDRDDNYLPINSLVKNHRPKDPSIVDVPPDPLPIGKSKGKKKKPEEYPPAPLGFAL